MEELHLDLREDATRASIEAQLRRAMAMHVDCAESGLANVDDAVDRAGVPDRHHHDIGEINRTIDVLSGVSEHVRDDMRAVYQVLAEAESSVHGVPVGQTHFHEVGRASGIRNALRICLMFDALHPEKVTATRVQTGCGRVKCAHGLLDVPAPATAAILARGIPTCEFKLEGERCTPTSAAIIYHFVDEFQR